MVPFASLAINAAIAILSVYAWLSMALAHTPSDKSLATTGLASLKYFTVLSNLFSGLVSAAYLIGALAGGGDTAMWLVIAKLMAASAVSLTFLTVILFLGPTIGWKGMYTGGNFWMHLILPIMAAVDCCLLVPIRYLPIGTTLFAAIPTVLYGIGYVRNVLVCKTEEETRTADFYGFLRWGRRRIPVVALVMVLVTWGIGLALYSTNSLLFHLFA